MTKKEYVLKVLDKVMGSWSQAKMVQEYVLSHEDLNYIDYLYNKFVEAVNSTLQEQWQDKINSFISHLEDIKQEELISKQADENDLKNLEQVLASL